MRLRPRALPLAAELMVAMVGLVVATTFALTVVAHRSYLGSLDTAARAAVSAAVTHREQTITRLLEARRRSADGLLASAHSLCSEPLDRGRFAWSVDCVRPMIEEFRLAEGASSAEIRYRQRLVARSGPPLSRLESRSGALAQVGRHADSSAYYQLQVGEADLVLVADFEMEEFAPLFADGIGPHDGDVSLVDHNGASLIALRNQNANDAAITAESLRMCLGNPAMNAFSKSADAAFEAVRQVRALGNVCVSAQIPVQEALAPASALRRELVNRGIMLSALGVFISLLAAGWIARPVQRLAAVAKRLKEGKFEYDVSIAGPAEVRALGRALRAMATDLDRRMTSEQTARREAEDASRAKDELIAMVSHELRTPLSSILGWSEILTTRRLDEVSTKRGLDAIHKAAESQRRLVDDLLDVSRIANKQLGISSAMVDLTRVVHTAVDSLRPEAAAKGVRLELHAEATPLLVRGDAERLQQVLLNLAENAVKFTPVDGTVKVVLEPSGTAARITVTDTGVGISGALLPHIFEWFRQGDSARTRRYSGLGVGLGIVRHLVQLHGGDVHAESRGEGYGSTFVVNFPLLKAGAANVEGMSSPSSADPAGQSLKTVRVLLVEDDGDMRTMVQTALEAAGAHVIAVSSAAEARRVFTDALPDVLLSDIAMPEEDGYSLIRSLRSSNVQVPAIALTALARPQDAEEAKAAGFQVHLAKPVTPAHLVETVAAVAFPASRVA